MPPAIVYNITTLVAHEITGSWLQWLKEVHNPAIIETGCFSKVVVHKMLGADETDGLTFAVQYFSENIELFEKYRSSFEKQHQQAHRAQWGEKALSFSSVLEIVH